MVGLGRAPECEVLVVCRANLCRSPMAQLMLADALRQRQLQRRVRVASAGVEVAVIGRAMDPRAKKVLAQKGVPIKRVTSRAVDAGDFQRYRLIVGLDGRVAARLRSRAPEDFQDRVVAPEQLGASLADIPDPYFGPEAGFTRVYDLLRPLVGALADRLQQALD